MHARSLVKAWLSSYGFKFLGLKDLFFCEESYHLFRKAIVDEPRVAKGDFVASICRVGLWEHVVVFNVLLKAAV